MIASRRTVAFFTGSRSEYGLLVPILRAVAAHPSLDYRLIVGGSHGESVSGRTAAEIEGDGFHVDARAESAPSGDTPGDSVRALGEGVVAVGRALTELKPDAMLVYGDRFESFAALTASTQLGVPTAHVEGGDYTEGGAFDDSLRHAMTKLAHLHFTTNADATGRVLRLGEEPWRVHEVGLPALDVIRAGDYVQPEALAADLGLSLDRPVLLFCQHSVATEHDAADAQVQASLEALRRMRARGVQIVLTAPNDDAGGRRIAARLNEFAEAEKVPYVASLGRRRFHGALALIGRVTGGAIVGNSSAGIKEAVAFGAPAVNIGTRQQGRLRAANVLDVPYDADAIARAMARCIDDAAFRTTCSSCANPYGDGRAGERIAEALSKVELGPAVLRKRLAW